MFIQEYALENVVYEMASIFSRPLCVISSDVSDYPSVSGNLIIKKHPRVSELWHNYMIYQRD